ncbi:hypothetical protein CRENPOLYSF2_2900003 [Crenothrix polyspora]|uniref:Uncharacterized protein n=1 Tax=Crenothrix polyspora TaxID=360316 RepID=A0A1R4H958_9GAMM|nr:hypothetical protein [Crenothrix polyspora]SJM92753.1 hypothetical protein CRENPOLYSF2_2900003 [Crenothrix polyspora]
MTQLTTKKDTSPFAMDGDNLQNNVESVFFENLTDDLSQDNQDMANLASLYASDSPLTPIDSITDEQLILEAANVFDTLDLSDNQETPDFSPSFKASRFAKPVPEKDINHKTPASTSVEESTKTDTDDDVSVTEAAEIAIRTISLPIDSSEENSNTETINSDLSATADSATDTVQIDSGIIIEEASIASDITLDSFLNDMPTMWICYLPALETISMPAIDALVYSDGTPVSFEPVQLIAQSSDSTQI